MLRIGFFGTPELAAHVLSDLLEASHLIEVAFVVTNPDKPIGRTHELSPTPIKKRALEAGIAVFTPERIRGNVAFIEAIEAFQVDYCIVVAYGRILPIEILELPKKMCINVHGSILPKYRGASPIQAALLHGETETGVTIMEMSEGMDEGDILAVEKISIDERETAATLFDKFSRISGKVLIDTLIGLENKTIFPTRQDILKATYCTKITKEEGLVDWNLSAREIYHHWQAYTPWPGVFTYFKGKRLLIEATTYLPEDSLGEVGTVKELLGGKISVISGEGCLILEKIKLEGKKSQSAEEFARGQRNFVGGILGK